MKRYVIRRNGSKLCCVVARNPEDALRFVGIRSLAGITVNETCFS